MTYQASCFRCRQPEPTARTRYEHGAFALCDECAQHGTPTGTPNPPPKHRGRARFHAVIWAVNVALRHDCPAGEVLELAVDHDRGANSPPLGRAAVEALVVVELRKHLEVAT
jgi:hypothetical protein